MKALHYILVTLASVLLLPSVLHAQADRHEVRSGNRSFKKGDFREADVMYRKALIKDTSSVAANYDLASALYRQEDYENAGRQLEKIKESVSATPHAADYWYNAGDVAIAKKDWQGAVDALKQSLLLSPDDMDAKENYIYAKKMLENQQNGGGGGDQDQQQQDQNQDQDQQQQDQNRDQNQDQNQDQQQQDQQQDQNQQQQQQSPRISPQQAQQMLQAIQAREKETQDKVNKEKAEALQSRKKEKNW